MSPYESDPSILLPMLDLATDDFKSTCHHYVRYNKEDTKEKTGCYVS